MYRIRTLGERHSVGDHGLVSFMLLNLAVALLYVFGRYGTSLAISEIVAASVVIGFVGLRSKAPGVAYSMKFLAVLTILNVAFSTALLIL